MTRPFSAIHLLIVIGFAVVAMAPMLWSGITTGNDTTQHLQFARTAYDALASGELYPGFSASPNDGLGDVGLRFYPPFSAYMLASIYAFTGDWYSAALIAFVILFAASGIGSYLWALEVLGDGGQALAAAAIFTFAPYHLNLIYNNGLVAEFAATAVFPFCLYCTLRVCRGFSVPSMVGLAASYSLLILTHLPTTIIISIGLAVYALANLERSNKIVALVRLSSAAGAGILASSFYWARMLPELAWLKHSSAEYFSDTFAYGNNFLFAPQNLINFQTDILNLWLADLMLLASILTIVPLIWAFISKLTPPTRPLVATAILFGFAVFMATPLSSFIWDQLGFLQKVQFPWRWMGLVTASGAILSAAGFSAILRTRQTERLTFVTLGIGLILVFFVFVSVFLVRGAAYKDRAELSKQIENLDRSASYIGWWPLWAKESARAMTVNVTATGRAVEMDRWVRSSRAFTIAAGEPAVAHVRTFFYPHWRLTSAGTDLAVTSDDDGLIAFRVPPERTRFELTFEEPASVKLAYIVSGFMWMGFGIVSLFLGMRTIYAVRKTS